MNPFFSYFGSKHRLSRRYDEPRFDTIIEPFAGSAGYATRHWRKQVILVEKNPRMAACWRYLISASPREILSLPDVAEGQSTDEFDLCQGARDLIGLNIHPAVGRPPKHSSTWGHDWGRAMRARIAAQLMRIRHWQIIEGDYTLAPDIEATWHIDPPYQVAGYQYGNGCQSKHLDFAALGAWCMSRRGQVMVCESQGADWLPFRPFSAINGAHRASVEVIWTNDAETQATA